MRSLLKEKRTFLAVVCLMGILSTVSLSVGAVFEQRFFDSVMSGIRAEIWEKALVMMGFEAVAMLLFLLNELAKNHFFADLTNELRIRVLRAVSNQKYSVHKRKIDSQYISILTNNINMLQSRYFSMVIYVATCCVAMVTTLIVMAWYNPLIALISVIGATCSAILPTVTAKGLKKLSSRCNKLLGEFTDVSNGLLHGFDVLYSFGMSRYRRKMEKVIDELRSAEIASGHRDAEIKALSQVVGVIFSLMIAVFSGYLIFKSKLTFGKWIALRSLNGTFTSSLTLILQVLPIVKAAKAFYTDIDEILESSGSGETAAAMNERISELSVERLGITYENGKQSVLNDLALKLKAGKKYALIGDNGTGKSTLARILAGFLIPTSGSVAINGKLVDDRDLVNNISYVPQDVYVFTDTIKNNITLGEDFDEVALQKVYTMFSIDEIIAKKLYGADEVIVNEGDSLSGGEKQRIALARAYIRHRPVLILDEGTSAIDKDTTEQVESSLLNEDGLTLIAITHDVSPEHLSKFDRVIAL